MKLQFSLATLLVCMTVLAAVIAVCATIKVPPPEFEMITFDSGYSRLVPVVGLHPRPPTLLEISQRAAWATPLSLIVMATTILTVRRLKSFRRIMRLKRIWTD
jgi:hypothetical protein